MIGIRVDANAEIATGHVMRCLAIANGLRERKENCIFIVADKNSEAFVAQSDFPIICLESVWNDLNNEIPAVINLLQNNAINTLLIDTYYVTPLYLSSLEKYCRVVYLDDLNAFSYPVSVVINYNLYAADLPYEDEYTGSKTKLFLGPKFAPLRSEFIGLTPVCHERVQKILVTVGGVDVYNVARKLLSRVVKDSYFDKVEFHVIVGRLNQYCNELFALSENHPSIILHQNVTNMAELMMSCDIAVSAGGTTMYELCACGLPSVCLSVADNQLMAVKAFSDKGLMEYAGDIRCGADECISRVVVGLKKYMGDYMVRRRCSKAMSKLVDGQGVKNICEILSTI